MSLGFQNAGFDVVAAFDNWKPAVDTYEKNFDHPIFNRDLADESVIEEIRKFKPDLIVGGPPCQDFSIAGYRNHHGDRANLTLTFSNIVAKVQPGWFVMENVYSIKNSQLVDESFEVFRKAGYGISFGVFDASLMGVPQARNRFFAIGKLGAEDGFLDDALQSELASKQMTVKDYLGSKLGTGYYYMHPRSYKRRAVFSIDEPSATIRGVNRPIPENYKPHNADKEKNLKRVKALNSKERSYLQTFPEHFHFEGSKTSIEQQIGNAVPVKMAEYVAQRIMERVKKDDFSQ